MKKNILWVMLLLIITVGVIFIAKSEPTNDYVVKIGVLPTMASELTLEIALQKGFFKEAGVNVQVTELATSNLIIDALIRGDIDVTSGISIIPFVHAEIVDPGKLKIFAITAHTNNAPFDSIIVKSDSGIESINDLNGKKIGVFPGTTATNMLKIFFKEKGIDTSGIQFVQLPPPAQLAALSAGSIDVLYAYEPTVSIALSDSSTEKIYGSVFAEMVNYSPIGASFLTTKFINEYPSEAEEVVIAINKAYDYIRTNDKETREIAQSLFQFTPQVTTVVSLTYLNHSSQIDKGTVTKLLDLFVTEGEIKSRPDLANAYYQQK